MNTRSSNKFYIPFCRTNKRKFSVFYQGPVFFNKLQNVKKRSFVEEFMHSHGHKTTVFVKMNSYIILEWGRLTKPHLMGALIRKGGGLIGRRALNRIVTVITVLEAILTGKQSHENIQCFVYFFFLLAD